MNDQAATSAATENHVAPFGVSQETCLGRAHSETSTFELDPFELDLRRVLACSAFRRLQYKTQVFISPPGDHFRTRLTHTLEVANLARNLARALQVNVTLAEVIALAHDLGHPPFGHAGEGTLNYLMREHGGFEHNAQSLRVVDYLEHPFPPFRGLNLTYEVREALAKHRTAFDHPAVIETDEEELSQLLRSNSEITIEGQVASLADRIAYCCHDLEDALGAELMSGDQLAKLQLWEEAAVAVKAAYPDHSLFALWRSIMNRLQHHLLADAASATLRRLEHHLIESPDHVRQMPEAVVGFSDEIEKQLSELEAFLKQSVYEHPKIRKMDQMAGRMITELFHLYLDKPDNLPQRFYDRVNQQGIHRVACDYLAGMTDRFCENEYKRIFLPFSRETPELADRLHLDTFIHDG